MMRTTGIQEMFLATFLTGFTLTAMAELAGNQLHIIFPTKKISSQGGTIRFVWFYQDADLSLILVDEFM